MKKFIEKNYVDFSIILIILAAAFIVYMEISAHKKWLKRVHERSIENTQRIDSVLYDCCNQSPVDIETQNILWDDLEYMPEELH